MDRNLLITPVGPVERPAKLKARALRTHGGKAPAGGARKSSSLKELAPASATCLTCRACLLTTTAKGGRVTGRRHRVEGVATRAITVRNKKNSAIVRVCQLRMIVWLVEPPLVSSADHPCACRR